VAADNYPTPEGLAAWIADHALTEFERWKQAKRDVIEFLEPGCGETAPFARHANERDDVHATAIELRPIDVEAICQLPGGSGLSVAHDQDFLDRASSFFEKRRGIVDVIAGNPPYAYAMQFVKASLELLAPDGVASFLLRLGFLSSKARREFFAEMPPTIVTVLQRRPSFVHGKTDSQEYAVMTWFGNATQGLRDPHEMRSSPLLKWLDNSQIPNGAKHPKY